MAMGMGHGPWAMAMGHGHGVVGLGHGHRPGANILALATSLYEVCAVTLLEHDSH